MIRPMNTDKVLLNSYAKALRTKSTIITRVAITVNWTIILILEGTIFLIIEITTFPTPITNKTETDITTDASNSAVIARAEHIPKT